MMRLAVSNIAWPAGMHTQALRILAEASIPAIEVAPTMVWPDWRVSHASAYRQELADQGFTVSSLQAILFAKPNALLFGDAVAQREMLDHLDSCASLARDLGASPLVFGAPKNRLRGELSTEAAHDIATKLLREIAPAFARRGTCLCLEANPPQYGCDFLTLAADAARLIRAIDHPGIGLHLDTACMHLAGEDSVAIIERHSDILRHVHISEPFLGNFDAPVANHGGTARALRQARYSGWVVLEMRATENPLDDLGRAAGFLAATYGGSA